MISIEDRKLFARAEQKAREVKPRVSMVEFGTYTVAGSKGDNYTVKFSKDASGHWQAECNCPAHIKSENPKACYHIPSAYAAHKIQVGIRQQVRAADQAAPAELVIVAQSVQEIEEFITEAQALPDFDPDDYTAEMADYDRACLFG